MCEVCENVFVGTYKLLSSMSEGSCSMPYIKIHKVKEEIKHYSECMTLLQARNELKWIIEHKCINCNEQCSDCYLHYKDKIAIEHILEYLNKTIPKRTINSKRGVLKGK